MYLQIYVHLKTLCPLFKPTSQITTKFDMTSRLERLLGTMSKTNLIDLISRKRAHI